MKKTHTLRALVRKDTTGRFHAFDIDAQQMASDVTALGAVNALSNIVAMFLARHQGSSPHSAADRAAYKRARHAGREISTIRTVTETVGLITIARRAK
jgi:RNA polymerase-interacting CarD/CdnL/TRCF family regulator